MEPGTFSDTVATGQWSYLWVFQKQRTKQERNTETITIFVIGKIRKWYLMPQISNALKRFRANTANCRFAKFNKSQCVSYFYWGYSQSYDDIISLNICTFFTVTCACIAKILSSAYVSYIREMTNTSFWINTRCLPSWPSFTSRSLCKLRGCLHPFGLACVSQLSHAVAVCYLIK